MNLPPAPNSRPALQAWLYDVLDLDVPDAPLLPTSSAAPLDYLAHAFFEPSESANKDCVVWASRGSGKTLLGAVATVLDLLYKPGVEVRILGGSLEQSRRMHDHLRALLTRPLLRELVDGRVTARRVRLVNGSVAETLAASETSVRGCRPQKLRCDEAELFDPDIWEAAQLVTRSRRCGGVLVRGAVEAMSTMHRPGGLMSKIVARCDNRASSPRLFRWTAIDAVETCPDQRPCGPCDLLEECGGRAKLARGHVPVDDLVAMKRRTGRAAWEAEMLCLRPRMDDAALPEFTRDVHVADFEIPAVGAWLAGMDFGIRAPAAIVWAHVDDGGVVRVAHERIVAGARLDEHIAALLRSDMPRPGWISVDPAGRNRSDQTGRSNVQLLQRAGLAVRAVRLPVEVGLDLLRARLAPAAGPPRLYIHPRCEGLIRSLESLPRNAAPSAPTDDHAADALRYLISALDKPMRMKVRSYW